MVDTGYRADKELSLQPLSWDYKTAYNDRQTYLSPALRTFQSYETPLLIRKGVGQYLWDADGRRYLDCIAQNLCISVGHSHPLVLDAVKAQLDELQHCTTMWMHPAPGTLAKKIVEKMPPGIDWVVHFVNSGSEAIDLALLLARVYTRKSEVLSLRRSYHGLHFSAMAATGMATCRQPVAPVPGVLHVSNPDQYRGIHGGDVDPYVEDVAATIGSSTSGEIAGILLEPIQGFGGVIPLPAEYIERVVEIVGMAGGLFIADEVQTGFGRTGDHFWGFAASNVTPDIIVMAKGIGNGFPIAAVVSRREIAEALTERKFFNTYGSNPVCCAAGRAVLEVIEGEALQSNARKVGKRLLDMFHELMSRHEFIGDVRGRGLMLGIELVRNRATKDPDSDLTARVNDHLRENGIILSQSGAYGNVLRICPPLCITDADADMLGEALDSAFATV